MSEAHIPRLPASGSTPLVFQLAMCSRPPDMYSPPTWILHIYVRFTPPHVRVPRLSRLASVLHAVHADRSHSVADGTGVRVHPRVHHVDDRGRDEHRHAQREPPSAQLSGDGGGTQGDCGGPRRVSTRVDGMTSHQITRDETWCRFCVRI